MKYFLLLITITLFSARAEENPVNYPENDTLWVHANRDTLYYNWKIYEDQPEVNVLKYNGDKFLSLLNATTKDTYWSDDNFKTWNKIPWIDANDTLIVKDYSFLENNKIIAVGVHRGKTLLGTFTHSAVKIYDIQTGKWTKYQKEPYTKDRLSKIEFKDTLTGIMTAYRKDSVTNMKENLLYKTTNGGIDWYGIPKIPVPDDVVDYFVDDLRYFKNADVLMAKIINHHENDFQRYFVFSKDFGETWTELRNNPYNIKIDQHTLDWNKGYYIRNDSLWFTGGYGTGHGKYENYEFIYFSPDLGKTWKTRYKTIAVTPFETFNSIEFFDNSLCGVVCEKNTPRILITFDGGENWTWIRDSLTNNGDHPKYNQTDVDITHWDLIKADNKMIFAGFYEIFVLNNLNVPKGVSASGVKERELAFNAYFDRKNQIVNIKAQENKIIRKVDIYTLSGQKLYTKNNLNRTEFAIPGKHLNSANMVIAMIQSGKQIYMKKILCE